MSLFDRVLKASGRYASEEMPSTNGYPERYAPRHVVNQVAILRALFTALGSYDKDFLVRIDCNEITLPAGAESWFAIPRWQAIAFSYCKATEIVLDKLGQKRHFLNWRHGELGAEHLHRTSRTTKALAKLSAQQHDADILIVPAQFGKRHAGRSINRAREVFDPNEFGLGAFETACLLLTHPDRLRDRDDLAIDCPGDDYSNDDVVSKSTPCFLASHQKLCFDAGWAACGDAMFGSVSGFLTQQ